MDQQNETIIIEETTEISQDKFNSILESESNTGSITGDNAGAYYGDYSQEIYQYLLQQDIPGELDDIDNSVSSLHGTVSNILIALVFFIFLFFAFKFIRLKGLDL